MRTKAIKHLAVIMLITAIFIAATIGFIASDKTPSPNRAVFVANIQQ